MTTIDWHELTHAYGSAADIPGLFARLGGPEDEQVWNELWSALCHQGSVYGASWAALPRLTDIARGAAAGDPRQAVLMAGAIVGDADEDHRERYALEIEALRGVTRSMLDVRDRERNEFVELLQSLLAFEGVEVWWDALEGVSGEEYELDCPACEDGLFAAFGSHGTFVSAGDYVTGPGARGEQARAELTPARPEQLDGIGARLYREAAEAGQSAVAAALTLVFGQGRCPSCDAVFRVADEVEKQWT
ncbi:hypothetical protein [Streptomyces chromofuscus]|uniref:Uncharacterized protein n=1 Tax=Streptomyces chromofuscus TaxID=42881 RepID=A0A7M2TCC4_STRCW|nr:hypothetical protein [Streptomyces chromofuscus]QOV44981.1 hypothetical protein IPT68_02975 [Streptomyces chromofuscus]GGT28690.1 hypothetical protein GCM10010254_56770 [Streptomyces chromofuscus]